MHLSFTSSEFHIVGSSLQLCLVDRRLTAVDITWYRYGYYETTEKYHPDLIAQFKSPAWTTVIESAKSYHSVLAVHLITLEQEIHVYSYSLQYSYVAYDLRYDMISGMTCVTWLR